MSEPLRIAFAVEGPTDFHMLKRVVASFLRGRDFVAKQVQPEESRALGHVHGGWPGVCRWCIQTADQSGGHVRNNILFDAYDLLIVQLDADVAGCNYSDGHIQNPFPDAITLPCEEPCPPPSATTDRLRMVVLHWLGEVSVPPRTVLCTPSKALETWVIVGLFPDDNVVRRRDSIECRANPERMLQGKPKKRRLVSSGQKDVDKYEELAPEFARHWRSIRAQCSEAARFEEDFRRALGGLNNRWEAFS